MNSFTKVLAVLCPLVLTACDPADTDDDHHELVDDWQYEPSASDMDGSRSGNKQAAAAPTSANGDIGLAAGGAMDINSFRENIENGYLPQETDITYEGLFYDYYFDRGAVAECTELFCPTYSQMRSSNILSEEEELFLSVGLSSGIDEADFARKKLNLVVVLDISGSMGSSFSDYYYDQNGNPVETEASSSKSKMVVANEAIVAMLAHLKAGDRFGMVLYDNTAYLAKPLSLVEKTDMAAIKSHILELTPQGGTNMEAGYTSAKALYDAFHDVDHTVYENRIVFLTDAMPNLGTLSEGSLLGMVSSASEKRVHTTFIGVGLDFNTELVEAITKVRGANYYVVHSEESFHTRMDEEFEFMVTPLVFDLSLSFESDGFEIDAVYGSPEASQATGELMKVNTLFPSKTEGGEAKGGIILLKLRQIGEGSDIKLLASYEDRNGTPFSTDASVSIDAPLDMVPSTGIQKGILLSRYVGLMKEWIQSERGENTDATEADQTDWEQTSVPLTVSDTYRERFQTFLTGFKAERASIGDDSLSREEDILQHLIDWESSQ